MSTLKKFRSFADFGVSKYRLPNLFNWIGIKFFLLSRNISSFFISSALFIKPNHPAFKKNLNFVNGDQSQDKIVSLITFPAGRDKLCDEITFFEQNQVVTLKAPRVINPDFQVAPGYFCQTFLPDTFLAKINDVVVFGGASLVLKEKYALSDEVSHDSTNFYEDKCPLIESKLLYGNQVILENWNICGKIKQAIHFTKDHSHNYFHWLVECLPRLLLIQNREDLQDIPLLIDGNLPQQFLDALSLLNTENRKIIPLVFKGAYHVETLFYPSQMSIVRDNYFMPTDYSGDIIYSPKALNFIRNTFRQKLNLNTQQGYRKLFISREKGLRMLLNRKEIEEALVEQGFEIVFPEQMSFATQARLFAQAKIIVGPTGAGFTNLLFAPNDCKVLIFASDSPQTNLHIFGEFADMLGISLSYLIGKLVLKENQTALLKGHHMHADYSVDKQLLMDYIANVA